MSGCCVNVSKLREIRQSKGLTVPELAILCNIGRTTIWRIEELPDYRATICSLMAIAKALEVPVSILLYNDGNPTAQE